MIEVTYKCQKHDPIRCAQFANEKVPTVEPEAKLVEHVGYGGTNDHIPQGHDDSRQSGKHKGQDD
jgi:hypothetical protein